MDIHVYKILIHVQYIVIYQVKLDLFYYLNNARDSWTGEDMNISVIDIIIILYDSLSGTCLCICETIMAFSVITKKTNKAVT